MTRERSTYNVTEIPGELMRFRCESWSDPSNDHTVDLLGDRFGNASCDCWDYSVKCIPNKKLYPGKVISYYQPDTKTLNPDRTECKHCEVVKRKFLATVIPAMAARHFEHNNHE